MKGVKTLAVKKQMRKPSSRAVNDEVLHEDLEKFRQKALGFGASDARVIPAPYVLVQERIWMKCLVPRCGGAGQTPYCPPNTPQPDFMRKVFSQYRWAVFFKRDIRPVEDYIATSREQLQEKPDLGIGHGYHGKTHEIVDRLESYAQTQGYDLAMGFTSGTCKANLCNWSACALLETGQCRFPSRARPSMEGVGIDVFDLCNKVGWDVYMIRHIEPDPSIIPCGISAGIVFIY